MAEEFHQGGVCGSSGSWAWTNPSRNLFNPSPCSYNLGSFCWPDRKTSSDDSGSGSAASDTSVVLQDPTGGNGHVAVSGSTSLPMMGLCSIDDVWNQGFIADNTQEEGHNYPQINKNFQEDSFIISSLQQMNNNNTNPQPFPPQPSPDSLITTEPYATIANFPTNSPPYNYNSSLLQTLFDSHPLQSENTNYQMYSPHFLPELTEPSNSTNPNYSLPKPHSANHFQFTNSTPLCNPMAAILPNSVRSQSRPSSFASAKPDLRHMNTKHHNKETPAKKSNRNEPVANKRARTETPSPLPAFKVRKEKLGDRITALQQLVSPFGKTDTASVLQEAIEYIKFLHDQVHALSAPYLKNGTPPLQHQQVSNHRIKDKKVAIEDLKSLGLCLVPVSSTFPVTAETTSDFWTPTFGGGGFR